MVTVLLSGLTIIIEMGVISFHLQNMTKSNESCPVLPDVLKLAPQQLLKVKLSSSSAQASVWCTI
jgi:hypothetical protein